MSFTVYYFNGSSGFTSPTWMGYPTVNMGARSAVPPWLLSNGLPYNADPQSDPNGDGVNLLMAYALNLDPNQNLSGSIPQPVFAANQMRLTFYAGRADVNYTVESSTDLQHWSTDGVTLSDLDAISKERTATVDMSGTCLFMRLVVDGVNFVADIPVLPQIDTQPVSSVNVAGSTATFTVTATGTEPLFYQWRKNDTIILTTPAIGVPGDPDYQPSFAAAATLALTNVQLVDVGSYSVVVTNAYGSVTSSAASLTLTDH